MNHPTAIHRAATSPLALSLLALLGLAAAPTLAADGDLDLTFHTADGGIFQAGSPGDAETVKVLPAPDGTTVVVYHYTTSLGTARQDRWRQVTETGTGTFCPLTGGSISGFVARNAIFDRQGRLVVVGTDYDDNPRQAVVQRFLYPECTLDPEFDGNGIAGYLPGELAIGVDIAAMTVGGLPFSEDYYYLVLTMQDPVTQVSLLRLHLDGSPDTGWGGGDGRVDAGLPGDRVFAVDMEADAHGRLVVAVWIENLSPEDFDFGVFRFTSAGALDSTFDGNGMKAIPFNVATDGKDTPHAIAVSSDDRIAVVGTVIGPDYEEVGVAVLRKDGSYESAFDGDGKLHLPIGFSASGDAGIFQSDGKLLVGGSEILPLAEYARTPAISVAFVARFGTEGGLDPDFGAGGVAVPESATFANYFAGATALALDAGRPMVGGYALRPSDAVNSYFLLRMESRLIFADGFESRTASSW